MNSISCIRFVFNSPRVISTGWPTMGSLVVFVGKSATESVSFDHRLYAQDIAGSIAHAQMLANVGIVNNQERDQICCRDRDDIAAGAVSSGHPITGDFRHLQRKT